MKLTNQLWARHRQRLLLLTVVVVSMALVIRLTVPINTFNRSAQAVGAKEKAFSGVVQVQHTHQEDEGTSQTTYILQTPQGENLELNFKDPKVAATEPLVQSGTQVTVRGVRYGNSISLASTDGLNALTLAANQKTHVLGAVSATDPDLPASPTVGTHLMAFVMFNFTTDQSVPTTVAQIRTSRQDIHDFFYEQSYGKLNMASTDADIYGTYVIDKPSVCDARGYKDAVNGKAAAAGVSFSKYQHIIYVMPIDTNCPFGSGTDIGANWVMVNGNRYMGVRVIGHELGHNLGLDHASGVHCRAYNTSMVNPLGGLTDCDWQEYYDPFDIMDGFYDLK
jgi:hypothetical protein